MDVPVDSGGAADTEDSYLKHENRNIFVGTLVPHLEGATCHHKNIPKGHGKFVISMVFLRDAIDWGYYAETQSKGCFIMWPMKDCRRRVPKPTKVSSSGSLEVPESANPVLTEKDEKDKVEEMNEEESSLDSEIDDIPYKLISKKGNSLGTAKVIQTGANAWAQTKER